MGVSYEHLQELQQVQTIEKILRQDSQFLKNQFSQLRESGLQNIRRQEHNFFGCKNAKKAHVYIAGSNNARYCTISIREEFTGLAKLALTFCGNNFSRDLQVFFPSKQYVGTPSVSYVRKWSHSRAKREEQQAIDEFINNTYKQASTGLLLPRQRHIIRLVEQANDLLQK